MKSIKAIENKIQEVINDLEKETNREAIKELLLDKNTLENELINHPDYIDVYSKNKNIKLKKIKKINFIKSLFIKIKSLVKLSKPNFSIRFWRQSK